MPQISDTTGRPVYCGDSYRGADFTLDTVTSKMLMM